MRKILGKTVMGIALLGLILGLATACRRSSAPVGTLQKKAGEKVARIVFVGQQEACDCTQSRVRKSWDALQAELTKHPGIQVERIALDTDRQRARALRKQRRFMVVPAVYFFNPQGKLVGMLEGELKQDMVEDMLK